jgi:hypothetical protein
MASVLHATTTNAQHRCQSADMTHAAHESAASAPAAVAAGGYQLLLLLLLLLGAPLFPGCICNRLSTSPLLLY